MENGRLTPARPAGKGHNLWDEFRSAAAGDPSVNVTHEVAVVGRTSTAGIVETLEKFGCDLIVIGSHDHGRLRRLFRGSLTNEVIHHAHCPVLVVKAPLARSPAAVANLPTKTVGSA